MASARGGYREATGIRRPPFRVRQRVKYIAESAEFGFSDRPGPMPPTQSDIGAISGQIQPYFARICHNLPYIQIDLIEILHPDPFSAPDA